MTTGIVVASANGKIGIERAVAVLREGGSALDAVVAGIEVVEADPNEHSVGYSGLPNLLGEVELDASVMDGRTLATGAVGALKGYQDAIALARRVMEELPHTLIVGDGAARLAEETGFAATDLLTPEAERIWRQRLDPHETERSRYHARMREIVHRMSRDPELPDPVPDHHGTVNMIARDRRGDIACGVSTSGWAWKYPGRLGDSPIIGAGNYADNRWGAAACTGRGEMAQRCCTAHSVVTFMRLGMGLDEAVRTAMDDIVALDDPYAGEMNVVAIDADRNHAGASTSAGKTYVFMRDDMDAPEEAVRIHVPFPAR